GDNDMSSQSIPFPRILMGPGPSTIATRVLEAMARAPLGHLDPELFPVLDGIQAGLRTVFGTSNSFTIANSGTGMAGVAVCLAHFVEPGDNALIGVARLFRGPIFGKASTDWAHVTPGDAGLGKPL